MIPAFPIFAKRPTCRWCGSMFYTMPVCKAHERKCREQRVQRIRGWARHASGCRQQHNINDWTHVPLVPAVTPTEQLANPPFIVP